MEQSFSSKTQTPLFPSFTEHSGGALNDAAAVRRVLIESIRTSNKSRAIIADEMSHLTATRITERMLNAWTAESREDHRWPGELDRAFCMATGSDELLKFRARLAGYQVISREEVEFLELGRQYFARKSGEMIIGDLMQRIARRLP